MSSTAVDHSPSQIRNLVFLGSTGSGKSSTCNTIHQTKSEPFGPFVVGNDESSCTESLVKHVCKYKDLNLIDTPGFDNSKLTEEKVNEALRDVGSVFLESDERNSKQIDAFVLVTKLTPRAQTLRSDVERVKELFGAAAFKSLILLLIYEDGNDNGFDFVEKLRNMTEVVKIMKDGKTGKVNSDWFCVWDNENPRENQEAELLEKIGKLKPYTHLEYSEFNTLTKQANDIRYKGDFEKEQVGSTTDAMSTMEELDERGRGSLESSGRKRENSIDRMLRLIEMKHQSYSQDLDQALIQNNEMIEKVMDRVEELEKGAKNVEQHVYFGTLFMDLVCCKRKLKPEERKELTKATLKKGAKVAAKEGAQRLAVKGGEEVIKAAKETAKKGAKEGAKKAAKKAATKGAKTLIKSVVCNMF